MPLVLLKAPEKITLGEIRQALFGQREALFFCEEIGRMFTALHSGPHQDLTLAELAKSRI